MQNKNGGIGLITNPHPNHNEFPLSKSALYATLDILGGGEFYFGKHNHLWSANNNSVIFWKI